MYHDSLEEVNQVRSKYEAKLILAYDNYTTIKAENDVLKDKVDVLFKLGRSYINRKESSVNTEKREKPNEAKEDDIETVTIEDVIDDDSDLNGRTQNKMRGFKRTGPATASSANRNNPKPPQPKKPTTTPAPPPNTSDSTGGRPPAPHAPPRISESNGGSPSTSSFTGQQTRRDREHARVLYCHYFYNYGKCLFEERTGGTCRFEHKAAPVCQSGMACQRKKCMYKHPNTGGMNTFLDQNKVTQNVNPWQMQMMNPWINSNQFPSPWNMDRIRN